MNDASIREEEGKLLNVIESLGELEWRKYQSRYPLTWVENKFQTIDHSCFPPVCSFRFAKENSRIVDKLKQAVDSYRGKIEWVMVGRKREKLPGTNWMICAKRYWAVHNTAESAGMPTGKYMAEQEPAFGPVAYEDLIGLTEHIRTMLKTG